MREPLLQKYHLNPKAPIYRGLAACWPVGDRRAWKSQRLRDIGPGGHHMDLISTVSWKVDERFTHVWCATTSEYLRSNYNGLGAAGQSFSVGIWYRNGNPAGGSNRFIVSNYVDSSHKGFFAIGTRYETGMFAWLRDTTSTTVARTAEHPPAWDNQWHHYLFARDIENSEVRFYIDGVLRETVVTSNTNAVRDGDSFIGLIRHNGSTSQTATGRVGLVCAWLRALDDGLVRAHVAETRERSLGSLVRPRRRTRYVDFGGTAGIVAPQRTLLGVGV